MHQQTPRRRRSSAGLRTDATNPDDGQPPPEDDVGDNDDQDGYANGEVDDFAEVEDEALLQPANPHELNPSQYGGNRVVDYARKLDYYHNAPESSTLAASRKSARNVDLSSVNAEIRHILPRCKIICKHCGALHWPDEATNKKKIDRSGPHATFRMCCDDGKVPWNAPDQPYPALLKALFTDTRITTSGKHVRTNRSRTFHNECRHFNNSFSYTSLGIKATPKLPGHGPPIFRIQGALYHHVGTLLPPSEVKASFLQLYIYSELDEQEKLRDSAFSGRDRALSRQIAELINAINPYAKILKNNAERLRQGAGWLKLLLKEPPVGDQRRYNKPVNEGIAAIIPDQDDSASFRDIAIELKPTAATADNPSSLKRIKESSPHYLPLRYALLFPHGECSWHDRLPLAGFNISDVDNELAQEAALPPPVEPAEAEAATARGGSKRVSPRQWFAGLFQQRHNQFNPVLHAGQLLQELAVDAGAVIEAERLSWLLFNQSKIRADLYQGVQDYLASDATTENANAIGRRTVLPSSYAGSPRNMSKHYYDAMALASKHGPPDLFVTMTCNPGWIEIQREMLPGESAADRPDLCARVFKLKLDELIEDITSKRAALGLIVTYCYAIEFQKRGLPHSYILLTLSRDDKPKTTAIIDQMVCAEIPDPDIDPQLFAIVTSTMLHAKCGLANKNAVCMQNSKQRCHAYYPKQFCEETHLGDGSYPTYRRREQGIRVKKGKHVYDNRDVVPYNRYLSRKLGCHINTEIATNVKSFKYIYKYAYKGPDRIGATIRSSDESRTEINEITEHRDAR